MKKLLNPFLYAHLVEGLPFLGEIYELNPGFAKEGASVYLEVADLSVHTTWSLTSPDNATDGLPITLYRVEGDGADVTKIDVEDFPFGIAVEHALSPTATNLVVHYRRMEDKSDAYRVYCGVDEVVTELVERQKVPARELLAVFNSGLKTKHVQR